VLVTHPHDHIHEWAKDPCGASVVATEMPQKFAASSCKPDCNTIIQYKHSRYCNSLVTNFEV